MKFETENELCKAFQEWAAVKRWTCYPETDGWDLLVVDQHDQRLGIQAKLKDGPLTVSQAMECMANGSAHVGAILMPEVGDSVRRLCKVANLLVIVPVGKADEDGFVAFDMRLPKLKATELKPRKALPRFVPEVPAGVPSPRKLTAWTEKELRLEVLFHRRGGWVNTKDFQRVGLRTNQLPGWLCRTRSNHFEQVIASDLPSKHHPKAFKLAEKEMKAVRV